MKYYFMFILLILNELIFRVVGGQRYKNELFIMYK
jgi:hypothetical protein